MGYKVYFFDDKPVAVSTRHGRKMDEIFEWISKDDYKKVKEYVMSFAEEFENPKLLDLDEELGETYKVEYYSQMLKHHKDNTIFNNEKVKIVDHNKDSFNDGKYHPETVQIEYSDGKREWVKTNLLEFPFNVVEC